MTQLLPVIEQNPAEPGFVQHPFTFYAFLRSIGNVVLWKDLGLPVATTHAAVMDVLHHPDVGPAMPHAPEPAPAARSLARRDVAEAVRNRPVALFAPRLSQIADRLIDGFPEGEFDLLDAFARPFATQAVAHLLALRDQSRDALHSAELSPLTDSDQGSLADVIGNAIALLDGCAERRVALQPDAIAGTVEETLRFRPPIHLVIGRAHAPVTVEDVTVPEGAAIGCLLGSACRDDSVWPDADRFDPFRIARPHLAFGHGPHTCAGAPLVRLGLQIALPVLYARCPFLTITSAPSVAARFPSHGFERLTVRVRSAAPTST